MDTACKPECDKDHWCACGALNHVHRVGTQGCTRFLTPAPEPRPDNRWFVDGHEITEYTLICQRGYHQYPCGCWSRWPGSSESLEA